ncbi:alpha/beta fold hydrolase [Rhizobiales bacterium RZME27]|uniref:Alpha/beta fold hydrolase n=1 Tax=Endobacterium cereale TaxID=2663029 RepID=A0A6A8AAE5_9HYPH|nr:alpha/beta fold hydrolase [Endobacterium cereale]
MRITSSFPLRRLVTLSIALLTLTSCARPGPETLTIVTPVATATAVSILVATDRVPDHSGAGAYTAGRGDTLRYAEVTVSIPPGHRPSKIEWPTSKPDPRTTFAVVARRELTAPEFVVLARGSAKSPAYGHAGIFVHGYNYSHQEALFRLAQMTADSKVGERAILFDWPSQAEVTGYVADKDSAAFARDDLATVLSNLSVGGVRSTILAHSMGAWLAVESVRQLSLTGNTKAVRSIDQMVLAAPDIDIDLLRKQLSVTGKLSKPIVVLASKDDLALALSKRLAGSAATAGSLDIDDPRTRELAVKENIEVVDISSIPSLNGTNHDRFASLAAIYPQLRQGFSNPVAGTGALVLNGVGGAISAPFRLGGAILAQ